MSEFVNFPEWTLVEIHYRKASRLYSMEPIGVGSSMVESLSSYIARLANEHHVKTGVLFNEIFVPYLAKDYLEKIAKNGGNGFYDAAHMINGVSTAAAQFASMLNDLTGNTNLQQLTLLRFAEIIPQRELLKKNKAWCPACYEEMVQLKCSVYDPLIWIINPVSVCIRHYIRLVEHCSICSKTNLIMDRRSTPGFCSRCNSWLGNSQDKTSDEIDNESFTITQMTEQLLMISEPMVKNGIITTLKNIVRQENSNIAQAASKLGIPKSTFWVWAKGKNLPPLKEVARICNKYAINIVDFYSGQNEKEHLPVIFAKRKKKVDVNLTDKPLLEIYRLAKDIVMDSSTGNLHVKDMAGAISCNKKTLYNHFRFLCREQASKYKQYLRQRKNQRIAKINHEVTIAARKLQSKGGVLSIKKLERILNMPAVFREKEIKDHLKTIYKT